MSDHRSGERRLRDSDDIKNNLNLLHNHDDDPLPPINCSPAAAPLAPSSSVPMMATQPAASPTKPFIPPLPLSASQEGQVREIYHTNVRSLCSDEIKRFAECARNRTVTATWVCRTQRKAMNGCMVANATQENFDKARAEWFEKKLEERRLRAEKAEAEVEAEKR